MLGWVSLFFLTQCQFIPHYDYFICYVERCFLCLQIIVVTKINCGYEGCADTILFGIVGLMLLIKCNVSKGSINYR